MLEPIIYVMCQCLENSLQSRTEKLKVEHFDLSVLEINQVVSAVNLLDREILRMVTVHLPFEDQVFTADGFIPLIEGQGQQRLNLRIQLHKFSLKISAEVRKLLTFTSQLISITIICKTIDEKCIETTPEAKYLSDGKFVKFSIDHAEDPIEGMTMLTLSDNKFHLNIFEIPSIMRSIAPNLGCRQIQSLRKVSRRIRHCVDYIKPDPHIISCSVFLANYLRVDFEEMMNEKIVARYKGFLEQEAIRVVNDFDLNTRHQKSCMDQLYIGMYEEIWYSKKEDYPELSKIFKGIRDVLISRTSPLKVKRLTLSTRWQCLMMNVLPFLDGESLKSIRIQKAFKKDKEYRIDLDEISKTEQWSKAKELNTDLTVRTSIQDMNILMFERIFITLETMSQEDITYCRKNIPQSLVFKNFSLLIKNCSDFLTALGDLYRIVNNIQYIFWFRIENTPEYLYVNFRQTRPRRLVFSKVHQDDSPFF
ncbi:hypothetical protein GCK72_021289 [Caenorhabditis remanei]|uniref:DUF38 domain-containing protein n=1 Tax=Caenorhabditis remanei TaxID=31234 RepID=A0A6A5GJH2_CAERE|nr:hypothetical protein GCK72_021289 [Caenorhabditis remanei]KAF1754725.1 hypothetical protein GCK72_021289 [Caenorhabditis remanei]